MLAEGWDKANRRYDPQTDVPAEGYAETKDSHYIYIQWLRKDKGISTSFGTFPVITVIDNTVISFN